MKKNLMWERDSASGSLYSRCAVDADLDGVYQVDHRYPDNTYRLLWMTGSVDESLVVRLNTQVRPREIATLDDGHGRIEIIGFLGSEIDAIRHAEAHYQETEK